MAQRFLPALAKGIYIQEGFFERGGLRSIGRRPIMREVHIEHKRSTASPWVLLLACLIIAGVAWWAFAAGTSGSDEAAGTGKSVQVLGEQRPAPRAQAEEQPLSMVLADPSRREGVDTSGELTVDRVVSGHGFFANVDGRRVFVLSGAGVAAGLSPGDRVSIRGEMRNAGNIVQMGQAEDSDHQVVAVLHDFLLANEVRMVSDATL